MKILLTGATGFLGNNLLRLLLEDHHQVIVNNRQGSDPRPLQGLEVDRIECDLADPTSIVRALDDVDVLIHSAAVIQLGWSQLEHSRRINVHATRALAQAARMKNIRMIHVSTVDTLAVGTRSRPATETDTQPAKPACSYVVSKREAEQAFMEQVERGLDGVVVHPGFMLGPWDWKPSSGQMMLAVARKFTPLAPAGGCSVVDVRDVACGILSATENARSGERYVLAGENLTYFDLWKRMAKAAGGRPPFRALPAWINRSAGLVGDTIHRLGFAEPIVNSAATEMGSLLHWYSSEKAKSELGYRIGDVDIAMADAWQWFQANGYV